MRNIKLIIQYDGTNYCGWQRQKKNVSVQETLETALSKILREDIVLTAAGRTDSGVHAQAQVANFKTASSLGTKNLFLAINSFIPKDIRVTNCEEVPLDFHARFSAIKREYKYLIHNNVICPPFIRAYTHFVKAPLNVTKLDSTLQFLCGHHDFTSFASSSDESNNKLKTIYSIKLDNRLPDIAIYILGSSFLRRMVRMIMGCAISICLKGLPEDEILRVLSLKDRKAHQYPTAPPQGLYLNKIYYDDSLLNGSI